jgi:hypothetical protein
MRLVPPDAPFARGRRRIRWQANVLLPDLDAKGWSGRVSTDISNVSTNVPIHGLENDATSKSAHQPEPLAAEGFERALHERVGDLPAVEQISEASRWH